MTHRRSRPLRTYWRLGGKGPVFPAPFRVAARSKPTFLGRVAFEAGLFWARSVPLELKALASLRASSLVGCVW